MPCPYIFLMNSEPKKKSAWLKILFRIDHLANRIYSNEYNPLYQSGTLAILFLAITTVTGLYLVFFYKVSLPYESVVRIQDHIFLGKWTRSVHRFASDMTLLCVLLHIVRLAIQRRFDGPRLFAWIVGVFFAGLIFMCGWTGLIMIWDMNAHVLATNLARILDLMPIFIEPIELTLVTQVLQPKSFFFMLLFLHVSLPLGLIFVYWLHTSRLARAKSFPQKNLSLACIFIIGLAACLWPAVMDGPATIFHYETPFKFNFFYTFWLPLMINKPALLGLVSLLIIPILILLIPYLVPQAIPKIPSFVHEKSCTGCTSCYHDCPYEAISMVGRTIGQGSEFVAHVNPDLCVSCGICAAACDPMGVGPAGKTGRDQLKAVEMFTSVSTADYSSPVIMACEQTWNETWNKLVGLPTHLVTCSGNVHTSVVEYLVRKGFPGVLIFTCPQRNCFNREGPKWLYERIYNGHDSALKEQVDIKRIKIVEIDLYDTQKVMHEIDQFSKYLKENYSVSGEKDVSLDIVCKTTEVL